MLRYEGREEFFGSIFYDFKNKDFLAFDKKYTAMLKHGEFERLDGAFQTTAKDIELIKDNGTPNYSFIKTVPLKDLLSAPLRLHLAYTAACNLRCAHCLAGGYVGNVPNELTFKEKIGVYEQMTSLGIHEILIGGGEPFIKKDFVAFLKEGEKRRINQKVFTNGLLLDDDIIDQIKDIQLGYLSISLDGACDKSYYEVRHVNKFDQVVDTCKKISKKVHFPVVIQTTATKANMGEVEALLEVAAETGVSKIKIRPLKPGGSILNHPNLMLSADEYLGFIKRAQEVWNVKYKNKFKLDYSWGNVRLFFDDCEDRILIDQIPQPHTGYGCLAGKISTFIDPFGKTYPCVFLDTYIKLHDEENIRKHKLIDIWKNGQTFNFLRNLKSNSTCQKCGYYASCRGGCIARILYAKQRINGQDPWCLNKYFPMKTKQV
jgi:radical SAM protein with 4Fe4S-binding SPASM domain